MNDPVACEACGGPVAPWRLDPHNALGRCSACGHLVRDLVTCPARHRSRTYGGDPGLDAARLRLTYRLLRAAAPGARSVFEVGYGAGGLLRRFLADGREVAGTDPGHLDRPVHPSLAGRPGVHRVPLDELPEVGTFDLVYAVHVVEHVADPAAFLASCARLVRPGGTLALLTPAGDGDLLRLLGSSWWMLEDPTHVRFLTPASAARLLHAAGLTDVRVSRPLLDSATTEAASLARRVSRGAPELGVLSRPAVRAAATAALPLTVPARLVRPALRASLLVLATGQGRER